MNGCIIINTPIAVDFWNHRQLRDVHFFFLTHLHDDHIKGLTSSWRFPIYTSPMNKILLKRKFEFPNNLVISLELNVPHILNLNTKSPSSMSVTLIDANHVPGAVMFLFQGYFGNILYCGDMRFESGMLKHPSIEEALRSGGIDELYLDNTFCCPSYNFPSRAEALQQVIRIIEDHPNHCIKLGVYKLGKEEVLESIALKFQELILVCEEKFNQLKAMKRLNVYTTDSAESRIEALNCQRIHSRNHFNWNEIKPTIGIKLTALYYGIEESYFKHENGIYIVPYSDHSSWGELHEFVRGLKPKNVIPIVRRRSQKTDYISKALATTIDMSVFKDYLSASTTPDINVPEFLKGPAYEFDSNVKIQQKHLAKGKRNPAKRGVFYESFESFPEEKGNLHCPTGSVVKNTKENLHENDKLNCSFSKASQQSPISKNVHSTPKSMHNQKGISPNIRCYSDGKSSTCKTWNDAGEDYKENEKANINMLHKKILRSAPDNIFRQHELSPVKERNVNEPNKIENSNCCYSDAGSGSNFKGFDKNNISSDFVIQKTLLQNAGDNICNQKIFSSPLQNSASEQNMYSGFNVSLNDSCKRNGSFEGFTANDRLSNMPIEKLLHCSAVDCICNQQTISPIKDSESSIASELNFSQSGSEFKCLNVNNHCSLHTSHQMHLLSVVNSAICQQRSSPSIEESSNESSDRVEVVKGLSISPITKDLLFYDPDSIHNQHLLSSTMEEASNEVNQNNSTYHDNIREWSESNKERSESSHCRNLFFSALNLSLMKHPTETDKSEDFIRNNERPLSKHVFPSEGSTSNNSNESPSLCGIEDEADEQTQLSKTDILFSNYFATNATYRKQMYQNVTAQSEKVAAELKKDRIPFEELNTFSRSLKKYINTF